MEKTAPVELLRYLTHNELGTRFQFLEKGRNLAEGLCLFTNIFSEEEIVELEKHLLDLELLAKKKQLKGETSVPSTLRLMLNFGYHYQYFNTAQRKKGVYNGIEVEPLTEPMKQLRSNLVDMKLVDGKAEDWDSFLLNLYEKGGGIPAHIDNKDSFLRPIVSVRILNGCMMQFGTTKSSIAKYSVYLPRGSVLVMDGYSANFITHSIENVLQRTASFTIRKVKRKPVQ